MNVLEEEFRGYHPFCPPMIEILSDDYDRQLREDVEGYFRSFDRPDMKKPPGEDGSS